MEEMTINLKDLIYRILKKWRQLILLMLIGAVLLTVLGGVKSYQAAEEAKVKREEQIAAGGPKEGEKEIVVPAVQWVSVTNIVLGAFVGAFVVCGFVAVPYLVSGKLRTKGDLKDAYGVTLLGSVRKTKIKKRVFNQVDHWLEKVFYPKKKGFSEENRIEMICTDIKLAAKRGQMKTLYLTGAADDKESKELMDMLSEKLEESLSKVSYGKSVVYDSESLENLVEADGVVLVERVDASGYVDIERELEFCKRYEIPVIGCVVVE